MKTDRDLNYRLYIQRNDGFTRNSFERELSFYRTVQAGDVESIKKRFEIIRRNFLEGKGTLSNDPVRNMMYHFVTSVALVARFCVEGGMDHNTAYTLSDIFIQRADKLNDVEKIIELLGEMQLDFTERMKLLKKDNVVSLHVRKCIDYIYEHLHEELTLTALAKQVGLNPSYLSKLFSKEKGMSIKNFIIRAKVSTAENLLRYSDFSCLDISLALGFSSQSAFISVFKKVNGITPKKFRELHYLDVMEENNNKGSANE
ncbi:AraC family transcriptional regulator [Ruminococcus flavefaciens]|uniref:AraC family transcriptional regulator n=1 Tax=Ruminococcus flavefaciens TaxID=1265 RepID=UPI0026EAE4CF|nr:AraC family transcriptional regulator [Ruminococcus flavefaciens]MDD7517697.1 AraC family transcriptional regulator [Ruminococcus flavefaciens]MDY5690498.1 AraC family transcriptional regulator [Ruminococcus flavefaciens]